MNVKTITLLLITTAALSTMTLTASSDELSNLAPGIRKTVAHSSTSDRDSLVDVVVFLHNDLPEPVRRVIKNPQTRRADKIRSLARNLPLHRGWGAQRIEQFLAEHSHQPSRRLWIVPAYTALLSVESIEELARLKGVKMIVEDAELVYDPPIKTEPASPQMASSVSGALELLNVRPLWEQGLDGEGTLVCNFDTGVEWDHPALADKWRGNRAPLAESWFSKVSPDNEPSDRSGHGTHTMGIMVGAAAGDTVGVAPGAEWISAGVIDQGRPLQTTLSDIIDAFQWAINPDGDPSTTDDVPDVISNSWGVPKGLFSPCDDTFTDIIETVEAAGIVTIFAAGNEGPAPVTMRNPADWAGTPLSAFSVGAVDQSGEIAGFSSRGPSSCDPDAVKPEVVAPGVSIRSCAKGGGFVNMQGTSQAAPFIAGLVALMRQYNPEATAAQIKTALIQAAVDKGDPGEDNDYGYGLVDAARLLDYLPAPGVPSLAFVRSEINGDGIPMPGETFDLQITLSNQAANIPTVHARLLAERSSQVTVETGESGFYFGPGGVLATNFAPFVLTADSSAHHGSVVELKLVLSRTDGTVLDTIALSLTIGMEPQGHVIAQGTSDISFSVSDFAQYGLGTGSIYPAGGEGFRFRDSDNLLYEAGIVVARNPLELSSSLRDSLGGIRGSDFRAGEHLAELQNGGDGGRHAISELTDYYSEIPIPVTVTQDIITWEDAGSVIMFTYMIRNHSVESLHNLSFGFMADFDLSSLGDSLTIEDGNGTLVQAATGDSAPMIALLPLTGLQYSALLANDSGKPGFTSGRLYSLLTGDSSNTSAVDGDAMFMVSSDEYDLKPNAYFRVSFAIVAGHNHSDLEEAMDKAREKFDLSTGIDDLYTDVLPDDIRLLQNYPNPFNPATTIAFELDHSSDVSLAVYNALGQKVTTLVDGVLAAGPHEVIWDGTDRTGAPVATGVYFYRLASENAAKTRKMLLLK
jgi:bacillopeptidase F